MIFSSPIPFADALASRRAKRLLPTTASSAELARLAPEIRERAFFSARTSHAGYLADMDRALTRMVAPSAAGSEPTDPAQFRLDMRARLARLGYRPDPATAGGLQDLGSDARLNLIVDTNLKQAYGYGQFSEQQDPETLDDFPCLELYRMEDRNERRDWQARWVRAGGQLFGGRMIARKDSPVWAAISRFGTPYPPFDFNSGMWTRDVARKEAEQLGAITRRDAIAPQSRRLNESVESALPQGISSGLAAALQRVFKVVGQRMILEAL